MNELSLDDGAETERHTADRPRHHRLLSLDVRGGFLDGTRLDFSDGLNCVIGGRGTGKTTVLEFIRYILGMIPEGADDRPRAKALEGHIRSNLGSGTIQLDVETKHGTRYRAERPWGDDVQVLDSDGEPVRVSLDRDLVFKADIYSQNEIEQIATNLKFQLSLIDKFAEEAIRAASAEIAKAKRSIEQSATDLRHLDHRIAELEEVVPEIEIIGKQLQEMQLVDGTDADAQLINDAHAHKALRPREMEAVTDLRRAALSTATSFAQFADAVAEDCATAVGDGCHEGPNGELFEEINEAVEGFVAVFREAVPKIEKRSAALVSLLDDVALRLADAHARQEQQYREIVARSTQEQQQAAERATLQQRHLELARVRQELETRRQKRTTLEICHRQMNTQLSELRDRRFALRKEVAGRLSAALGSTIRVSITQSGDRSG